MPEPETPEVSVKERRWIKEGTEVAHKDFPERKMIVDEVLKRTEFIHVMGREKREKKTFMVGIQCHWFDDGKRYDSGRFLTMELIPYKTPE